MIATKINTSRIAGPSDLYSINWIQSQLIGSQKISKGTRGYIWFLLALVKQGFETISATQREIADAYYRASGGNKSVRSLQYALKELEEIDFIRRSKYRIGPDHFRSVIVINTEAFSFWTRKRTKNISPIPTQNYTSPYAQNMQKDTGRSIKPCNYSPSSVNENKEPRVRARCKTNARQFNFHPIIFSLLTVLRWPKTEPPELRLARAELAGQVDRTEIAWPKWEREWQRLPIDEREGICRTSFLPRLRDHSSDGFKCPPPAPVAPIRKRQEPPEPPPVPATREQVLAALSGAAFYKRPVESLPPPPKSLSETDMKLLCKSRDATEDRRKGVVQEDRRIPDISSHDQK